MKRCLKCGEEKSREEFSVLRAKKDGLQKWCKACYKACRAARYIADREKERAQKKVYREANREKVRAKAKEYYEANREKVIAWKKAYLEANPEKGMLRAAANRARKNGLPFDLALSDITIPKRCPVPGCGRRLKRAGERHEDAPSLDRIVPERGYVRGNVVVICMACNRKKQNSTPDELEALARFSRRMIAKTDEEVLGRKLSRLRRAQTKPHLPLF